jgi:Alcohol dehydrogenase, class IV
MVSPVDYHLFGTHVRFAPGCASSLRAELDALGCSRPIILMQRRMLESTHWQSLSSTLGGASCRVYGDVPTHGGVSWVESVARDVTGFTGDCIVAIGGGSVSDSAKALAMLLAEGGRLEDHATRFTPPASVEIPRRVRAKLPIISLPTTASGAEVTPSFGARSGEHKLLFWNPQVSSTSILIDPLLSADVPMELLRYTAMNGLAHCFEGLYSLNRSFVSDALALQAVEYFSAALVGGGHEDMEQRSRLLLGGHASGMVLSMAKSCLHHAICHVIGARHSVGHGVVNTVILPHALRFNEGVAAAALAPALTVLNRVSGTHFSRVSDWLQHAIGELGLPRSLKQLGIKESDLPTIAAHTMSERGLAFNPRPVTHPDEVISILEQAL